MLNRLVCIFAIAVATLCGAFAQKTTDFTYTMTITGETHSASRHASGAGFGLLGSLGPVAISVDLTQGIDPQNNTPLDDYKGTISFVFNRLDSIDVAVTIAN